MHATPCNLVATLCLCSCWLARLVRGKLLSGIRGSFHRRGKLGRLFLRNEDSPALVLITVQNSGEGGHKVGRNAWYGILGILDIVDCGLRR